VYGPDVTHGPTSPAVSTVRARPRTTAPFATADATGTVHDPPAVCVPDASTADVPESITCTSYRATVPDVPAAPPPVTVGVRDVTFDPDSGDTATVPAGGACHDATPATPAHGDADGYAGA